MEIKKSEQSISRILFPVKTGWWPFVWDACYQTPLATYPKASDEQPSIASLFGLAPDGVYRALRSPGRLVRSYRTVSPLPRQVSRGRLERGGLLSVALAFASPRLHVMEHPALWCSDFPPGAIEAPSDHLACSGLSVRDGHWVLISFFCSTPSYDTGDKSSRLHRAGFQ